MSRGISSCSHYAVCRPARRDRLGPPAAADRGYDVPDDAVITIEGDGSGHGRGMSQYGAYCAAREGVSHREILGTYYPKTRWAKARGSIEVLVTADDDNDLVVARRRRGSRSARSAAGAAGRPTSPAPRAGGSSPPQRGDNEVSFFDGSWTTLAHDLPGRSSSGRRQAVAESRPDGTVAYRGALRSSDDDFGDRVTVNVLPLEQYVRGVVPSEMPARLAAAGAARPGRRRPARYAAWRRDSPDRRRLRPLRHRACQVYGGASAEHAASDQGRARRPRSRC